MSATATIIDFLLNQQRDSSTSLVNGTVTFYAAGTTSLKPIWTDSLKVTEALNPYTLDSRASAILYGDGNYKIVLKNANGVVIATWDNIYIGLDTSTIDLTSVISAVSLTNRDYIGNSQFNIWNFGTSFTRTTVVDTTTADGWHYTGDGSTAGTTVISRQSFTFGQTDVPENPTYYTKLNKTAATTGATYEYFVFQLPIRTAAAQQMTVRCYAKAAAAKDITFVARQYFGSGGSASVVTSTAAMTLTTSWAKYNKTFTIPSIASKTLGSGAYLEIGISLPVNTTFEIDVASFKFETGTVASSNEYRTTYEDDLRTSGTVSAAEYFLYSDLAGGVNEKYWKAYMDSATDTFSISTLDDAQSNPVQAIVFTRSGTSITQASLPNVPTPAGTDNTTKIATTAFVQQVALNTSLPSQTGNSGKFLTTNGTDASWGEVVMREYKSQTFNTSGTFTVPADVDVIFVSGTGAGGGGAAADIGGASGAACEMVPIAVTPGESITVTIGSGGAVGTAGGTTTFGSYISLPGGAGGVSGGVALGGLKTQQTHELISGGKMSNTDASTIGSYITGASTYKVSSYNAAGNSRYLAGGGTQGAGGYFGPGGNGAAAGANTGAGGGINYAGGSGKIIVWWLGV